MNKIIPIPAFKDNYIWAIHSPDGKHIAVVDPGDATPVLKYLQKYNLTLDAILITHHHWDHTGGIEKLLELAPHIPVFGSHKSNIKQINSFVKEGADITLPSFDYPMQILEIPGHTLDHVAYVGPLSLFCGDTLFSCGCGRLFEGNPEQMVHSLNKIQALDKETQIYCGHEYTLANIQFAKVVEPHNVLLQNREKKIQLLVQQNHPTLPVTLEIEQQTNPFLRCNFPDVIQSVQKHWNHQLTSQVVSTIEVFSYLRQWKDTFTY